MSDDLDPVFKALSDPTRRKILDLLNEERRTTGDLCAAFELSRFAVMKHLTVLENAGLISVQREGRERYNQINAAPLSQLYDRWVSRQAAWTPTIDGQVLAEDAGPNPTVRVVETEALRELYVIIRPEERYAVERALQSIVPPIYASMSATGRGAYWEDKQSVKQRRWSWRRREQLAAFLPKTILFMAVPETYVNSLLKAVGAALRHEGGPDDCGTGFAMVLGVDEEIVIGAQAAGPDKRVEAEGWAS